jgi:hypothetical protein
MDVPPKKMIDAIEISLIEVSFYYTTDRRGWLRKVEGIENCIFFRTICIIWTEQIDRK